MPPRSGRRTGRRSYSQRSGSYLWQTGSVDPTSVTQNGTAELNLLPNVPDSLLGRCTVERIIGTWAVIPTSTDSDGVFTAAIVVLPEELVTASAIEPQIDLFSYMWMDTIYVNIGDLAGGGSNAWQNRPIDVKARRKMRAAENFLMFCVENVSAAATTMKFAFSLRVLLRVP